MKTKIFLILSLTIAMVVFISCNNSTEAEKSIEPYISLQIGDMWQIYDVEDGYYTQEEVIDTTRRSDGLKVFIKKESLTLSNGIYTGEVYNYLKGNYLIQTNLDTSINISGNKFGESKLFEIFPQNGDYFAVSEVDSEMTYREVKIIDSLITPCGTFRNVAQYRIYNQMLLYKYMFIYYAANYGYIGSRIVTTDNKTHDLFITYKKFAGKELGTYHELPTQIGVIIMTSKQIKDRENVSVFNGR